MLSQLRSLFGSSPQSPRAQREIIDIMHAVVLSGYREARLKLHHNATAGSDGLRHNQDLLEKVNDEVDKDLLTASVFEARQQLQSVVGRQSYELLAAIERGGEEKIPMHEAVGFGLKNKPSRIPTANKGLFIEGAVLSGTLVAYFPGLTCLPEHMKTPTALDDFQDDPNHLILSRYDDIIIDSREFSGSPCPENPLALAHFANHPSKGLQPNVMQVAVDFPFDIDPDLEEYIPNKFMKAPTLLGTPDRTACMYGLGLVTIRDVKDEELFVNYRFQTGAKDSWPKWYSPVEGNDGSNRWDDD